MRQILIAVLFSAVSLSAQLNWVINPTNGHRYALIAPMTWQQAEAAAVVHGGHLVTIRSQVEQDWIIKNFVAPLTSLWIGFTDEVNEGTWVWTSGEPVPYTNWCPNKPDNQSNADYGQLLGQILCANGGWSDVNTGPWVLSLGLIEVIPSPRPGTYITYRPSCASSLSSTPQLTNLTLPKIGQRLQLQVTGMGAQKFGSILFGFNDQYWLGNQLPVDLAPWGAPGCFINIDLVVNFPLGTNAQGTTTNWSFFIPLNPAHLGLTFFNQYVTLNDGPPGRPWKITTTNAGKGVIGR